MKLRLPKSRLGWVFVGVYILSAIVLTAGHVMCMGDPWNQLYCSNHFIYIITKGIITPSIIMINYFPTFKINNMVLPLSLLLTVIAYYWIGKLIESFIQKRKSATVKRKK